MNFSKSFNVFCNEWNLNIIKIEELMLRGMKPGKILKREMILNNPHRVDKSDLTWVDHNVQIGLHALHAAQYATQVLFAYSYDKILEVYNDPNCPSCMMGGERAKIAAQFYAANGFVVAYRHDGEKVTARTLCFGKECTEFYGPESMKLSAGLQELEYTPTEGSLLPFWCSFEVPYHDDRFYIPYLDCASGCFIPYAGRHDVKNARWECLYVPYSLEYREFINEDDTEEFIKLRDAIERGDYLDRLLTGMPHGESCNHEGALHHLDRMAEPDLTRTFDLKLINGQMFWVCHERGEDGEWESETYFMDDFGDAIDRPYGGEYGDIHTEISLSRLGHF